VYFSQTLLLNANIIEVAFKIVNLEPCTIMVLFIVWKIIYVLNNFAAHRKLFAGPLMAIKVCHSCNYSPYFASPSVHRHTAG